MPRNLGYNQIFWSKKSKFVLKINIFGQYKIEAFRQKKIELSMANVRCISYFIIFKSIKMRAMTRPMGDLWFWTK